MNEVNGFERLVRYEQRKKIHHQPQNWLSGATGFNVAPEPALNNRLELLADNIESAEFIERSHIFI